MSKDAPLLRRCCASHPDWETMQSHLQSDFPSVDPVWVSASIAEVRVGVALIRLSDSDQLPMTELAVRNRLSLATGEITHPVRLDPESHHARRRSA